MPAAADLGRCNSLLFACAFVFLICSVAADSAAAAAAATTGAKSTGGAAGATGTGASKQPRGGPIGDASKRPTAPIKGQISQ